MRVNFDALGRSHSCARTTQVKCRMRFGLTRYSICFLYVSMHIQRSHTSRTNERFRDRVIASFSTAKKVSRDSIALRYIKHLGVSVFYNVFMHILRFHTSRTNERFRERVIASFSTAKKASNASHDSIALSASRWPASPSSADSSAERQRSVYCARARSRTCQKQA